MCRAASQSRAIAIDYGIRGGSTSIKVRRAGFNDTLYSDEMFAKWFARYQAEGLLPPLA